MQKKQQQLLHSAILALKSGGTLIYCTCSFAPEENEAVIDRQLKKFGETIKIEPIDIAFTAVQPGLLQWQNKSFHPSLQHAVRILPNETMQGFFICKLTKY